MNNVLTCSIDMKNQPPGYRGLCAYAYRLLSISSAYAYRLITISSGCQAVRRGCAVDSEARIA